MPMSSRVQQALEKAAKLAATVAEEDAHVRVDVGMDQDEAVEKANKEPTKDEKKLAKAKEHSRLRY